MSDEIIREAWRIKDEIAREHGHNLASLLASLKDEELQSGQKIVDLRGRKKAAASSEPQQKS